MAFEVDQRGRRTVTQPQAAHGFQRVGAVGRGLAGTDAELAVKAASSLGAMHRARPILADADHLAADRLRVKHFVESVTP